MGISEMIVVFSLAVLSGWAFAVVTSNPSWLLYAVVSAIAVLV